MNTQSPASKPPMSALPPTATETQEQKPRVGDIVHLDLHGNTCIAAMITKVHDNESVALEVFWPPAVHRWPSGSFNFISRDESRSIKTPSWHWREEA